MRRGRWTLDTIRYETKYIAYACIESSIFMKENNTAVRQRKVSVDLYSDLS